MTPLYAIVTAVTFIVVLGLLVLIHELGHFVTARLFGIRVEEFGLGFPPRLYPSRQVVARKRAQGKTVYSLNALPLGGFVRLTGETGLGTRPVGRVSIETNSPPPQQPATSDDPHAFASKPAWQRAIVLIAGAFNNMVLAVALVFFVFVVIGAPSTHVAVVGVALGSPAARAGMLPGDVIQSVDGQIPRDPSVVHDLLYARQGRDVVLNVLRDGRLLTIRLVPRSPAAAPCDQGAIGVMTNPVDQRYVHVPVSEAAGTALRVPGVVAGGIAAVVGQLATGQVGLPGGGICAYPSRYITYGGRLSTALDVGNAPGAVKDDPCLRSSGGTGFTGPIGIVRQVGCEANSIPSQGWVPLLSLVALLSADLAVVNILPIPALDGGRLLFVVISVLARRRIRPEVEGMAHALGMAALLTLIFIVSWHDLINLINSKPVF